MRAIVLGLAGLAALLAAQVAAAETLAIMPVKFLDTSGEAEDQTAAHESRLAALGTAFEDDLAADYETVVLIPEAALAAECPDEAPQCLVDLAVQSGADAALFAVVVKTSTLIMQMFVNIVAVPEGEILARRELNFRGDTDESWVKAGAFLVENLRAH